MAAVLLFIYLFFVIYFGKSLSVQLFGDETSDSRQIGPSSTSAQIRVLSLRLDVLDGSYVDAHTSNVSFTNLDNSSQLIDGQWVVKKDLPPNIMASWKFSRQNTATIHPPLQTLCNEIKAPMSGLRLFYASIGLRKCPVKQGAYSWNGMVVPRINIPKVLISSSKCTTVYEWLHPNSKPIMRFISVTAFAQG